MLVSVGIPSYNHAEFLPKTIESCLNQTYKDIEIIIVDDGSTDNSLEIARRYERMHPSLIQVFTHPDSLTHGGAATSNLVHSKFNGEFYSGLDSDDLLYPEKIEKQMNYLLDNPAIGWVYSKVKRFGARSETVGTDISRDSDPLESQIINNSIWGITVLSRRDVWKGAGPLDETLAYPDWDLWVRMLNKSKVGFIDEVLAGQRIHSSNSSVGIDWKKNHEHAVDVMTTLRTRAFEPKYLALINLRRSVYLFDLGRLSEARSDLEDAFSVNGSAAEYLAYFSRFTPLEYQRWAMGFMPFDFRIETSDDYIAALPNPIPNDQGPLGKTVIRWSTSEVPSSQVHVYVYDVEGSESLFARGAQGSQEAPWIQSSSPMEFRLYAGDGSGRKLLDRVVVTRQR